MRVLFLTHRLPYAPNRGDRIRSHHLVREIGKWADIDLISLVHTHEEASHAPEMVALTSSVRVASVPRVRNRLRGALALPTSEPLTHALLRAPSLDALIADAVRSHAPDIVFTYCTGIAPAAFHPALVGLPLVLDMVDVDSAKWSALGAASPFPWSRIYAREARVLARFERQIADRALLTLVTTEDERHTLRAIAPGARVEVVENGVDVRAWKPPSAPAESDTAIFCGVMDYPPNVIGAIWLATEVWPRVRQAKPNAKLQIVGADPTRAVLALASPADGIEVTGRVPDLPPYLWAAAVAAAPLKTARGVQNKVLEAVAAGLPTVVTPEVLKGLPTEIAAVCACADSPGQFAIALLQWLGRTPTERRAHAASADLAPIDWPTRLSGLRQRFESLLEPRGLS